MRNSLSSSLAPPYLLHSLQKSNNHHHDHHDVDNDLAKRQRPFLDVSTDMEDDDTNHASSRNNRDNHGQRFFYYCKALFVPISLVSVLLLGRSLVQFCNNNRRNNEIQSSSSSSSFLTPDEYGTAFGDVVPDGEACYTALDCGAGRWCAFPSMHNMSVRICCDEALHLGLEKTAATIDPDAVWLTVCTGAAVGEPCGSHHGLCASGVCVHGKCAAHGLQPGAKCPDDGACASGACGRYAYNTTRTGVPHRCCPTRDATIQQTDTVPYPLSFCHGTAQRGQPCGGHAALCQEGLTCHTLEQVCVENK